MPMKGRLPIQFLVKSVWNKFAEARYELAGSRLANFKGHGGMSVMLAKLKFAGKTGCYTLVFGEDGVLKSITHFSGAQVEVHAKSGFSRSHKLINNHSDHDAAFELPDSPIPPTKLATFFEKSESGPFAVQVYHSKPKLLQQQAEIFHQQWEKQRAEDDKKVSASDEVKVAMAKSANTKRDAALGKMRQAAKSSMEEAKKRRTLKLTESTD